MQFLAIQVNSNLRSTMQPGTKEFPLEVYTDCLNEFDCCISWHWHPEIQFVYVVRGAVKLNVGENTLVIREGSGAFVNSKTLHMLEGDKDIITVTKSFLVDPQLLSNGKNSFLDEQYIKPLINCRSLLYLYLENSVGWGAACCGYLRDIAELWKNKSFGYEFAVRNILCQLWYLLITNTSDILKSRPPSLRTDTRIKNMMTFIHENYERQISLADIAASANISKSECYRTFKKAIGMKPFEYLTKYRIEISMHLLRNTDMSVTDVAFSCGFGSSSYFGKLFKKIAIVTPAQYRKS